MTVGGLVSIAANFAHSFVPPRGAPVHWAPQPGAVIGAIVWPVFLFIAVEVLARVAWPSGVRWLCLRFVGFLPVAAVAALVSYRHGSALLAYYGEDAFTSHLGPVAVDGLMVVCTGALVAISHTRKDTSTSTTQTPSTPTPPISPTPSTTEVTAEAVNVLPPTPVHAAADSSTTAPSDGTTTEPADPQADPVPAATRIDMPSPADLAARYPTAQASTPPRPAPTPGPVAEPSDRHPSIPKQTGSKLARPAADTPVTEPDVAQLSLPILPAGLLERADQAARQYRTEHGTPITPGQLANRLRVNSEQASQVLALLDLGTDSPISSIPTVNGAPMKATR